VVTGDPGAGKSTWVAQQRRPGDIVWDVDAIAHAIAHEPHYPRSSATLSLLSALLESMVRWLEVMTNVRVFLIVGNADAAIAIAARIRANVLQLPSTYAVDRRSPSSKS